MTRRVLKYFQQRCNDYVSEFIGLERELVVHLGVGIHVADVVVVDQVHVTKLIFTLPTWRRTTWRHVCRLKIIKFFKSELIFTIVIIISLKMTLDCL